MITDFSPAQGDRLDLAGLDANELLANDQAFSFIGTAAFGSDAGQLRYSATSWPVIPMAMASQTSRFSSRG